MDAAISVDSQSGYVEIGVPLTVEHTADGSGGLRSRDDIWID